MAEPTLRIKAVQTLSRVAFLLERSLAESYRVQAFRKAAVTIQSQEDDAFTELVRLGNLKSLKGVGAKSEQIVIDVAANKQPEYLIELEAIAWPPIKLNDKAAALYDGIKGDCHTHSTWSDGGSPIIDMARTARELGRDYMVLTDHSPRLTVANGLTAERLRAQFLEIDSVNETLATEGDLRVLKGIEVDIHEDGALDQTEELLGELDLVVASVHSKLRMESKEMTKRMIAAVVNPHTDVLGHCTGRKVMGKGRPQSTFDAKAVFQACIDSGTAVEINCRPERMDPPDELIELAFDMGAMFSIDTDSHAPGQLDFMVLGCIRAAAVDIPADRIINTRPHPVRRPT